MAIFHDWCNKNELRNYPLEDLASKKDEKGLQLPDNFLVDANLWLPKSAGTRVSVSSAAVTPGLITITFVADGGGTPVPVAAVAVVKPITRYRKYAIEAYYPGVGGWVSFGGAAEELDDLSLIFDDFDAGLMTPKSVRSYDDLPLLSMGKKDRAETLTGLVELQAGADIEILACTEPWPIGPDPDFLDNPNLQRQIDGEPRDCIAIRLIGVPQDYENLLGYTGPCEKSPESLECGRRLFQYLNGVKPDCDGNIILKFRNIPTGNVVDPEGRVVGVSLDYPLGLTDVCDPDKGLTLPQREDICDFSSESAFPGSLESISGILSSFSASSVAGECPIISGPHIETFTSDLSCWNTPFGEWYIDDCQLVGSSSSGWGIAGLFGSSTLGHEIQSFIKIEDSGVEQRAYFIFGVESTSKFWFVELNAGLSRVIIGRRNGPIVVEESLPLWGPLPIGEYIHLRVGITLAGEITTFIDGLAGPQITAVPGTLEDGVVGFATRQSVARFDNLAFDWFTTNPALFPPFGCSGSVSLSSVLASVIPGFASGYTSGGVSISLFNVIDKFSFITDGDAIDVGDLSVARYGVAGQSSELHGYTSGGNTGSGVTNIIDKFPFATDANAADVGDLTVSRSYVAGHSSELHGYVAGGLTTGSINVIDKFLFATDGNAADVGNLTAARRWLAGQSSSTHGYSAGGFLVSVAATNIIDKFSFTVDGNAVDVGDLTVTRYGAAGQSSDAFGYTSGGSTAAGALLTTIDKFSFSVDGNAAGVGDLTAARYGQTGQFSGTHGYTAGGTVVGDFSAIIDKFSFAVDGNATDVGDLTAARYWSAGQQGGAAPVPVSSSVLSSSVSLSSASTISLSSESFSSFSSIFLSLSSVSQISSSGSDLGLELFGFTTGGGFLHTTIDKFPFATDADAVGTGDLTVERFEIAGQSSDTHGYTVGGTTTGGVGLNVIDKFLFATDSNATDVGDLTLIRRRIAGQSSAAHGYTTGGYPTASQDTIDKFSFSVDGNAADVGNLVVGDHSLSAGQNSATHGYTTGALSPVAINKFSFATDGDATGVGNLTVERGAVAGQSSATFGYTAGGFTVGAVNIVDKFPFAVDAGATDVGDLSTARYGACGQSSPDNGYISGGLPTSNWDAIDKFSFSIDGNSAGIGVLTIARYYVAGQQGLSAPPPVQSSSITALIPLHGYTSGGFNNISAQSVIDRFSFAVDGNAAGVGNLTVVRSQVAGQSSSTHGYTSGGIPAGAAVNIIDKFLFATTANAADVGNLTVARRFAAGQSSVTHGYTSGGFLVFSNSDVIDKYVFASDGNAVDVGDLTSARLASAGQSSATSGYTTGGFGTNIIDKFSFSADGNATDVGDLTVSRGGVAGQSSAGSGYTSGGEAPAASNTIDKFSFAADGNATDVGDLTIVRSGACGQSSADSGYTSGNNGAAGETIDKFSFSVDGNATNVGDLTVSRFYVAGQQG